MRSFLKRHVVTIALIAIFTSLITPAQATHLRGAVGSVVYNHTAKTITITSTNVARKDACSTLSGTNSLCTFFAFPTIVQVNRTTGAQTTIKACTGQATAPSSQIYDNTSQPLYNIFTTTYVIDVSCPTFSTSFDYIFSQLGMNRIGGIRNTTNQVIQFEGRIRIDGSTDRKAPVYNTGYMTNVAYDESPTAIFSTSLNATGQNASGADGYGVTYALVTSSASGIGGYGATTLPCSNFNTSTGVLQIGVSFCSLSAYQAAYKGGTDATPIYYAFKTIAYDAIGQYTTRDVLLSFSGTSNNAPTITRSAATNPVTLTAGQTTTFTYSAADTNTGDKLRFSSNTLPSWASVSTPLGTLSSSNSQSLTLTLSPPSGTNFAGTIYISTTDNATYPLSATNQLDITVGSGILPPGSPGRPTISTTTATFTAPTTGGPVVSYSAVATPITGSGNLIATSCATPGTSPLTCTFASSVANYTVVITATNSVGSANSLPSLAPATLFISNPALTWTQNVAPTTNYTLSQTGQPFLVYSIASNPTGTALPTGLTFNTSTGLITGTPTATRTITTYVITGSTGGSSPITSTVSFTLTVSAAATTSKLNQTITFPKMGQFPKLTANPTAPTSPALPANAYILQPLNAYSSSGLAISYAVSCSSYGLLQQGTGTNTATYYLGYIRNNSTSGNTTCSVTASQGGNSTYNAATSVSIKVSVNRGATSNTSNQTYTAAPGMASITYPGVATSVALQTGSNATTTGVPLTQALIHNYTGTYSSSNGITGSQGWTDCSVSPSLPSGLTFGAFTCQLAGTPTAASSSTTYTVTYRNPFGSTTKTFTMSVSKGNQTLTFPALSNMNTSTADQTPGATNSVSVANGGEAISYRTSNSSICTIVSGKIHPVANGTCVVTASAGSNSNYNAAVDVVQSFSILGAPILSLANGYTNDITVPVAEYRANFFPLLNAGGTVASWSIKDEAGTVLNASTIPMDLIFDTTTGILSGSFEKSQSRTGYYIVATNAAGSNQFHVYMTATKLDQTITFSPLNGMVVGNADQGLFALASSGLAVSYTTDNSSVCTIVNGKVHPVAPGICTVTASQSAFGGTDPTYNAAPSVSRQFSISAALTPPEIYLSNSSATVSVNQPLPWLFDVMNSGGAVGANGFTISPLPSTISDTATVITFDANYGVFTGGTPNRVGTTVFTITANNSATPGGVGSSIATFTLNVVAAPDSIKITQIGEMLAGLNASTDATIVATSVSGRTTITFTASPSNVCSIVSGKLHPVGYGTCVLSGRLNADSTWSSADTSINITIHAPPTLTLTTPVVLTGGSTYTRSVITQNFIGDPATKYELWDSTGAATNYTNTGLWSLVFNSSTGALTGTVTSINQAATTFMVKVTNPYGTASATVTMSVTGLTPPVISISNVDLTAYDQTYEFQDDYLITNTGQAATDYLLYTSGTTTPATLPAGLTFDTSAGVIYGTATTGTPMTKTPYDFYARNAAGISNKVVVSLTLINPVSITTSTTIPTASLPVAGSPFNFPLVGLGGFGAYTWSYINNSSWLTVDSLGNLVGTPPASSATNSFTIEVTVTDSGTPGMGGPSVSTSKVYSGTIATNTASTDAATNVTQNSATLNGSSGLSGAFSGGFFCYSTTQPGTSPNFAFTPNYTAKTCTGASSVTTSQTSSPFTANITGLTSNATYYMQFFVVNNATNRAGTLKTFKTFAATYTITGTAGANGSISPSGATTTNYGATPTYTITPNSNYHIASVTVDGVTVTTSGSPATYTFTAINAPHTISATFAPNVYRVLFNFDSANSGSPSFSQFDYTYGDSAFTLPTTGSLLRSNYTFIGWNTANGQSISNVPSPYTPTGDVTLYSAWTSNYSVMFDKGTGDSGGLASISGSGTTFNLPAFATGDMAKNGYHFNNWLSDDGTTTYANSATITISDAFTHTLTAQWTADTYVVTYNPNSGTVSPTTASYTVGNAGLTLATPTRTGYTFTGWFTPSGNKVSSPYSPTSSVTLQAQWSLKTYTIIYKAGTGSGNDIVQTLSHFSGVNIYDNLATTTNFSKGSDYFNGWKDASNNSVAVGSLYDTYADIVLTAQWAATQKFKVIYNPNATDVVGTIPEDTKEYLPGEAATVLAPTISRPGFTFIGWNTNKYGTGTTIVVPTGTNLLAGPINKNSNPLNKATLAAKTQATLFKSLKTAASGPISVPRTKNADPTPTLPVNGNTILYAMWGPLTYTVTYSPNSGTVSPTSASFLAGSAPLILPTPTREGYTFNGWYSSAPALIGKAGDEYTPTDNIVLTANWTANTYEIIYNPNGGSVGTPSGTYTFGGSALTLPTPTWTGRTFAGWSTASTGGSSITSPYSPSAAGTIFAKWTLNSYTVTYNANSGTVGTTSATWNYGDSALVLPTPTRSLYTFTGWYTSNSGGSLVGQDGSGYTPSSSITLYAQWSLTTYAYSINFNKGTGDSGSLASMNGTSNQVTLSLFNTGDMAKSNSTFDGWLSDDGTTIYSDGQTISLTGAFNHTLTARWAGVVYNYAVTFAKGTGDSGTLSTKTGSGTSFTLPSFSTGNMVKAGYTFVNWLSDDGTTTYADGATITISANYTHTFTAQWSAASYVIAYNANGGSVTPTSANFTTGGSALVLPTPTYSGYTFNGWFTAASGGVSIGAAGANFTPTSTQTIWARWTANTPTPDPTPTPTPDPGPVVVTMYTVTYEANSATSGSVPIESQTFARGSAVQVKPNTGVLSKTDFVFKGWNTKADGTGISYPGNGSGTFVMSIENVTLYAQWLAVGKFTITYIANGATTGTAPIDTNTYQSGSSVTLKPNSGNLSKSSAIFVGWNSKANGTGTNYLPGESLTMSEANLTVYAKWELASTHKISVYANNATSGTLPVISDRYKEGDIAQIPLNSGNLKRTGYIFVGWNTNPDGTGTSYPAGGAFKVGKSNLMLFAMWAKDIAPSATDGKLNFEIYYAMNSYFLDTKSRNAIEAKVASVRKKLSSSSEVTIRIVGWVQPTRISPNVKFLSTNRAQAVAKYMKSLGFKGTYILKYPGHDKDNIPAARHATVDITWTDSK